MIKSKKRFTLTTEAVNSYGFRVLTGGIDLTRFKSNPLMLWMHRRADGSNRNEVLPLGFWDDLQTTNSSITGVPVFDETDSFAATIYNKVENDTIRMASPGLRPVEWSDNQTYKLSGQTGGTLIRSVLEEVSLVDIGANADALAITLYNNSGDIIQLSTLVGIANPYVLNLAAQTWEELDRSNKLIELKQQAPDLFNKKYNERFGHYPDGVQLSATTQGSYSPFILNLAAKTWGELDRSNKLIELKQQAPDLYRNKFFERFGKYPSN